jgi:RimJ/RimL family protein N-acetyltransferase
MASLAPQVVTLPAGVRLTIRSAVASDASEVMEFWRTASARTDQIMTQPDEVPTLEEEASYLGRMMADHGSVFLLGLIDGALVATLSMEAGKRKRSAHVCNLGVMAAEPWRQRGVGTAMTRAALDWAAAHPAIEVVALCVFSSNPRAEALYRRFGFVRDGVRPKHAQLRPGEYVDDVMMTLFVKPGLAPAGYGAYVGSGAERPAGA